MMQLILSCVPEEESRAALTVGRAMAKLDEDRQPRGRYADFFPHPRAGAGGPNLSRARLRRTYRDMTIRKIRG